MKSIKYIVALIALVGCTALSASAQDIDDKGGKKKIRMEMGIGLDAVYTGIHNVSSSDIKLSPRIGFGGHFDMGVVFGRNFAIETEVAYQRGSLIAASNSLGNEYKVKTTTIDIPVLLSLRVAGQRLRFIAGPVFTVMSKAQYSADDQKYEFGPVSPTWNVAGGIAVCMGGHFQLEARYVHALKATLNQIGCKEGEPGEEFNTNVYRLTVGFSVLF